MGTVINGKKLAGACINGKVVSGLVKNGVVFYKKASPIYKRRIMVGDNLKGKTIYVDFPQNHYQIYLNMGINLSYNYIISLENSDNGIYENMRYGIDPSEKIYTISSFAIDVEFLYEYDGSEEQNNAIFDNYNEHIVSSVIEDNYSYRCLYIEDPNIGPYELGDNITEGTKTYFNFPDNLWEDKNIVSGIYLSLPNNDYNGINVIREGNDLKIIISDYEPGSFGTPNRKTTTIYEYANGVLNVNLSSYTWVMDAGDGSTIENQYYNTESPIHEYVLFDTTTLGS